MILHKDKIVMSGKVFDSYRERLKQVRLFVLDMDGTIYLSNRLFPFTMPFLEKLDETGRSYCFFTNNSSKNQQDYLDKLGNMGVPVVPAQVFLSTQVIIEEMQRLHPHDTFYIVGTPNLVEAFRSAGLRVFGDVQLAGSDQYASHIQNTGMQSFAAYDSVSPSASPASFPRGIPTKGLHRGSAGGQKEAGGQKDIPDVVILGFDTTLTYDKLAHACRYLRRGAAYYGVNMDYNCPVDDNGVIDYIPDCGSIAKLIERSTGRFPDFYGKPSRHALDYIIRHTGFAEEEIAVVGDRIYTDIAIANGTKALSIMVLTGETKMEDLEQYDYRPDIILPSLAEITELL